MRQLGTMAGFVLCLMSLIGCGGSSSGGTGVAVVNLDQVLKMTGTDLAIQNQTQERERLLREGIGKFQKELDGIYNAKKEEFGETPSDDQKKQLQLLLNELNVKMQQARNEASNDLVNFQQTMFENFRQKVSPISLEVAKQKGFQVVLAQNQTILGYDTTIDITDDVITQMQQDIAPAGGSEGMPAASGSPANSAAPAVTPPLTPPALTPPLTPPAATTTDKPAEKPAEADKPAEKPEPPKEPAAEEKPTETTTEKPAATEKPAETTTEKPAEEASEKPAVEPEASSETP